MNQRSAARPHLPHPTPAPEPLRLVKPGRVKRALRGNIRISLIEGSAFSVMVGVGETYLPAFMLWMGLGNVAAGLITTLPLLAGSLLQLVAPYMVLRLGSYRRWVVLCACVQGSIFLPLIACAVWGHLPVWLAFACAAIYWGGGLGASGAWNSWMGTLIPPPVQIGFFTRRTRLTQSMVFAGFCIGGLVLHQLPRFVDKSWAFVTVFAIAFSCRLISITWLRRQSEPIPPSPASHARLRLKDFAHRLSRNHDQGRLFTYLLAVTFSAHLAAPFFTSYMLGDMKLPYAGYAVLVACSYLAKVLMIPYFGRIATARGTRPLLLLGGTGIVILPVLWLFSHNYYYLMAIQALSGFVWGAYELASLLLIWELVKPEERTCAMTTYNLCSATCMSASSLLGGTLLAYFGADSFAFTVVFVISTLARGSTLFLLGGIASHRLRWLPVGFRTLTVRPASGFFALPIVSHIKTWRGRRAGRN